MVKVKILERCFKGKIDKEMSNSVDTVENKIQKATLTAIDSSITPKSELTIRSIKMSSGRDAPSVMANSERGKHIGITAPFEKVSQWNKTLHVIKTIDETRNNIPDEVSELLVPGTHFDWQSHTNHGYCGSFSVISCCSHVFETNLFPSNVW